MQAHELVPAELPVLQLLMLQESGWLLILVGSMQMSMTNMFLKRKIFPHFLRNFKSASAEMIEKQLQG